MNLPSISFVRIGASFRKISHNQKVRIFIFVAAIGAVVAAIYLLFGLISWDFHDWTGVFYVAGGSPGDPYSVRDPFYLANPPWLVWILFPFSLLPVELSFAFWIVFTIIVSTWCIFKLGGDITIVLLSLCSPAFVRVFIQGQIEVLPLLGFTLMTVSPRILVSSFGYILLAIKPQVLGLGAITAWLKLDRKNKVIVVTAVLVVFLVSLLIYGDWLSIVAHNLSAIADAPHGIHIWPYGIPLGLIFFGISLKRRDPKIGGLSTIFFVPYIGLHSLFPYVAVLFTMIPRVWALIAFISLWALALFAS
jgi:hypothetical protein